MHEVDGTGSGGGLTHLLQTPLSPFSSLSPPGGPAWAVAHLAGSDNDSREPVGGTSVACHILAQATPAPPRVPPPVVLRTRPPTFKTGGDGGGGFRIGLPRARWLAREFRDAPDGLSGSDVPCSETAPRELAGT